MLWRVVERHFTTPWDRIGDSKSKVKITSFYVPCSSIFDKNVTSLICKVFFRRQIFIIFSKIMYLVWYFLSVSKAKISSGENTELDVEFYNWAWQQGNVNFKAHFFILPGGNFCNFSGKWLRFNISFQCRVQTELVYKAT